ncbi:hypothetical protein FX983_01902 [Pseudomonas frederiksbergensis]|uniref:Uncharacterized protein n=2 Tax=Pseudomonas frederiksbergensis TaxID=104087 RepID=A0A6L5C1A6_9PSED|nr:hypothetical protein FX983_01902 [Pseudomonas frederiksbergensis]
MNSIAPLIRPNLLGDTTAENDGKMLSDAFVATADFRSLIESDDRTVVVGRRGTGKSAIYIELQKHWKKDKKVIILSFSPEDTEIIGFRSLLRPFSESFNLARAATKLLWKYTILMEMANYISSNYKLTSLIERDSLLNEHLTRWNETKGGYLTKCRNIAKPFLTSIYPEEAVGDLPGNLDIGQVEERVLNLFDKADRRVVVLMDRLDEGYESDAVGIGMIAGLTYAAIELNKRSHLIRPIIFLRDNIYRTLAKEDPDHSRNIEGQVIRLHWDWAQLLTLVTARMKLSFNIQIEKDQRVWDRVTAGELQGREGFKKCLQFTLYRPRDLLSLLNEAFFCAARNSRTTAVIEDLDHAAQSISVARLEDLWKEYSKIFPSIQLVTSSFKDGEPELLIGTATKIIENHIDFLEDTSNHEALAETRILQSSGLLQALYSVGFIGTHDNSTSAFSFCHDGRTPDKGFENSDKILIHPCYWLGLNLSRDALAPEEAEEINDEYDIIVQSATPEIRKIKIGQTVSQLDKIPTGREGAKDFEHWCLDTLRIIFASHLINLELAPNGQAVQRRDIVGTNRAGSDFWKRIHEDYKVRQVVFDAKNYSGLGPDEYRQLQSYLTGTHGKLGFIISRDDDEHMTGTELDWVREMHQSHSALIIKLPARFLCKLLQKLRNPEKHDAIDRIMFSLLDTYERNYLQLKTTYTRKPKKK